MKKKHWLYELFELGCYKFQGVISGYFPWNCDSGLIGDDEKDEKKHEKNHVKRFTQGLVKDTSNFRASNLAFDSSIHKCKEGPLKGFSCTF